MLKTYEAIYEEGQLKWLSDQPDITTGRVMVTILEGDPVMPKRRRFPVLEAGNLEILGDIISPIVDEEDWECLK
ncbi:MAG: hypothetical protein HC924_19425 [Synechococcaceae cyanobacterium SM2_3_2]|nr:hypothetical protein [Synechococcaceae cyanobacterium SM2_3_2]